MERACRLQGQDLSHPEEEALALSLPADDQGESLRLILNMAQCSPVPAAIEVRSLCQRWHLLEFRDLVLLCVVLILKVFFSSLPQVIPVFHMW